ncbi:MAG TPA: RNA methyltransferase [Longimicrobium sp.]|nr:RNA methyltransferase [Longimicrobium sp.]
MLSRREERLLRSLRQRRAREQEGLFLVEGVRAVEDLAASALPVRLAAAASSLGDTPRGRTLLDVLATQGVAVRETDERGLAALADTETPQGILAIAGIPRARLDDVVIGREPAALLVLDGVQDPGNFGTLARTAEALGAAGLVALPGTVDPWNPKSVRAAMGSTFRLPVVQAAWDDLAPWLSSRGFATLAAAAGGEPLGEARPARAALVLGNEGAGISNDTRARADRVVGIPLRGRAESLNVAAAGAILLYELLR